MLALAHSRTRTDQSLLDQRVLFANLLCARSLQARSECGHVVGTLLLADGCVACPPHNSVELRQILLCLLE